MNVTVILIVIGALGTVTKGLIQGLGDLEIGQVETAQTTVKIGRNTANSPGDLKRLVITQTPGKDQQLTLMWKTLKGQNNNNNNNNDNNNNLVKDWTVLFDQ